MLNVLKEYSALRSSGIQSTAFREEIRYVHDGFIFKIKDLGLCHGMGAISSAWQVQKPSAAGHLIDHVAWRFPLFS